MYSSLQLAKKYFHYYFTACNGKGHGMHSPFVFQFILHVLNNKSNYKAPHEIEALRKKLLADERLLTIEDLGAGSRTASTKKRSVHQIAKSALKSKEYAQVLFRLATHYQPKTIVELGTSLGLTTAYLATASRNANVITIEGSKAVAAVAQENFSRFGLKSVQLLNGNFDELLPAVVSDLSSIDLAYIDGNHRYKPTMAYFQQILTKTTNDSILVFDDIHWSEEMEKAWAEIKAHPAVRCTVDVFFFGFVFFREEFKAKQHFTVRF